MLIKASLIALKKLQRNSINTIQLRKRKKSLTTAQKQYILNCIRKRNLQLFVRQILNQISVPLNKQRRVEEVIYIVVERYLCWKKKHICNNSVVKSKKSKSPPINPQISCISFSTCHDTTSAYSNDIENPIPLNSKEL